MRSCPICILSLIAISLTPSVLPAQQAPAGSSSSKSKQKSEQHVKTSPPVATGEGAYHNANFGFTYRVPYGWVERTKQMQEEGNDPAKAQLLLAVFERPPEVTGDTVNSAVIIAAERVASYPGLRTAADYMGPLTELTTGKGFKVVHEPYEFPVGTKQLVRSDFTKDLGKLTMYQSSLALLAKGSIVSFTFIGGSEDEVDELVEKLTLSSNARPR
jgi:hypothetical protein